MIGGAHCQYDGEGREGGVGTGLGLDGDGLWAGSPSGPKGFPRPFNKFLFPNQFLFRFSFVIFAKHFQNDFKQLLKLANHFPSVC
jgi:hypothetical protein